MDIASMILPRFQKDRVPRVLDEMSEQARIDAVAKLGPKEQAALFEAAADNDPLTLEDFVPAQTPPLKEVIHEGKNSLFLFTRFQKRFCKPSRSTNPPALWGYNEQSLRLFTGPGYFVAHKTGKGIVIDYTRAPLESPPAWPPILPNTARLSRFIYNGTKDFMRRVSQHVTVGRAYRDGKAMDNWFVLVRREVGPGAG